MSGNEKCPKCGADFCYESKTYDREGRYFACGTRIAFVYNAGLKIREVPCHSELCKLRVAEARIAQLEAEKAELERQVAAWGRLTERITSFRIDDWAFIERRIAGDGTTWVPIVRNEILGELEFATPLDALAAIEAHEAATKGAE